MITRFFGLHCPPFEDRPESQFFHATPEVEETLATLEYECLHGRRLVLLTGAAGMGKTLVLRVLTGRLHARIPSSATVVTSLWPAIEQPKLGPEILRVLGITPSARCSGARLLQRLRRNLGAIDHPESSESKGVSDRGSNKDPVVILIDQAENLTRENLIELQDLVAGLNDDLDAGPLLSIVLSGQESIRHLLTGPEFDRLRQKLVGSCRLGALTEDESRALVQHRLSVAGAGDAPVFEPEALALMHRASAGVPRLLLQFCDAAMLTAFSTGCKLVDRAMARESLDRCVSREVSVERDQVPRSFATASQDVPWGRERGGSPEDLHAEEFRGSGTQNPIEGPVESNPVSGLESMPMGSDPATRETSVLVFDQENEMTHDESTSFVDPILQRGEGSSPSANDWGVWTVAGDEVDQTSSAIPSARSHERRPSIQPAHRAQRWFRRSNATSKKEETSPTRDLERRLTKLLGDAEERFASIAARVALTLESSSEVTESLERLNQTCAGADETEQRLRSCAERIADQGEQVQVRLDRLLDGFEAAEGVQRRLQEFIDRAESTFADADRRLDGFRGHAREQDRQWAEQLRLLVAAEARGQGIERALRQAVEDAGQRLVETRSVLDGAAETCRTNVDESLGRHRRGMEQQAAEFDRRFQAAWHDARDGLGQVRDEIRESTAELDRLVAAAREQIRRTSEESREDHQVWATRAMNDLKQELSDEANRQSELQRRSLEETMKQSAVVGEELTRARELARSTASELGDLCERERSSIQTMIRAAEGDVAQWSGRVELIQAGAHAVGDEVLTLTSQLADLTTRSSTIQESVRAAQTAIDSLTREVSDLSAPLVHSVAAGRQVMEEITTGRQRLGTLHERTTSLLLNVGAGHEKIQHAASVITRGEQVIGQLLGLVDQAHQVRRTVDEVIVAATETGTRVREQWVAESRAEVDQMLVGVAQALAPAREVMNGLEDRSRFAQQVLSDLSVRTEQAEQVSPRLGRFVRLLARSRKVRAAIHQSVQDGRAVHDALATLTESALEECGTLQSTKSDVQSLISACRETGRTAQETTRDLADQVVAGQELVSTLEQTVEETAPRCQTLGRDVEALEGRLRDLDQRLAAAILRPEELIEEVQTHSAQLERVSTVVRKVFAGLSRAGLGATEQIRTMDAKGAEMDHRIRQWIEETGRAADSLRQWVSEALRAQERLETLMEHVPTIRDTHSADRLRDMRKAFPAPAPGRHGSGSGRLVMLDKTPNVPGSEPSRPGPPRNRGEEVTRILEDVRKSVDEVGPVPVPF